MRDVRGSVAWAVYYRSSITAAESLQLAVCRALRTLLQYQDAELAPT